VLFAEPCGFLAFFSLIKFAFIKRLLRLKYRYLFRLPTGGKETKSLIFNHKDNEFYLFCQIFSGLFYLKIKKIRKNKNNEWSGAAWRRWGVKLCFN
jgi:hypothetical protein